MTEICVFVEKGEKFRKRLEINWGDGGVSIVNRGKIILRGKDGKTYEVPEDSEHDLICRKVILENGYSIS